MTAKNVCKYYNAGYCKHKERCKFDHKLKECDRKGSEKHCKKRHKKSVQMERTVS